MGWRTAIFSSELGKLLDILSEKNAVSCSLEVVVGTYSSQFSVQDKFRVGSALIMLLRHHDILSAPAQRLAALALLHNLYTSDSSAPKLFTSFFVELLQPTMDICFIQSGELTTEHWFLSQILSPSLPKGLFKKTPVDIINIEPQEPLYDDVCAIVANLKVGQEEISANNMASLPPLIPDLNMAFPFRSKDSSQSRQVVQTLLCDPKEFTEQTFEPLFMRPSPLLHPCSNNEMLWLDPSEDFGPLKWDHLMCATSPMKLFFSKASKEIFTHDESQCLCSGINDDPALFHHMGMRPQKLPLMVLKNLKVASEVLIRLGNLEEYSGCLTVLGNLNINLQSIDMVNKLTTVLKVPMEILHKFIQRCFITCRDTPNSGIQRRLVRLVCIFLENLIRNKIVHAQTLKEEIKHMEPFCLEHGE